MSEKSIEKMTKTDNNFAPAFVDHHSLPEINFNGHCLTKNNISIPKNVINIYISYTLGPQLRNSNTDFTLSNQGGSRINFRVLQNFTKNLLQEDASNQSNFTVDYFDQSCIKTGYHGTGMGSQTK